MSNYYRGFIGNLMMGDIAKSSDIHYIQRHIQDMSKAMISDFHDGESYILGSNNIYKNSFILKPAPKKSGRYIDSDNVFAEETDFININLYDVKQPLPKTKSSLYSIITKFKNTSNRNITITCKIVDEFGAPKRTKKVTLLKNTCEPYEIVFDLDFYPTPPNLSYDDLIKRDGKDIPPRTKEQSFDEGYNEEHENEDIDKYYFSAGVSKLYFVIERADVDATKLSEKDGSNEQVIFDANSSLGVCCREKSLFPDKDMFAEVNGGLDNYTLTNKNIYYKDVYANERTYLCSGGRAIINGEKIQCLDTHVSIESGNEKGNVLTQIYLGTDGHLHSSNRKAALTTNIDDFVEDKDDPLPAGYLPVGLILTYSSAHYGAAKDPLIIQDSYNQRPRSHHERLRRMEKQINWSNDIVLPSRIKYTINDKDWVDEDGEKLVNLPHTQKKSNESDSSDATDPENLKDNVFVTTDENGNLVVKLSEATTQTIPITLKEKLKDSEGKEITLKETDVLNASSFSKIEYMVHNSEEGTLVLDNKRAENNRTVAVTEEDAKLSEYNPWDDSVENRPANDKYEKQEREYKVVSGMNGTHDQESSYPGMTFYTDTKYSFKKLTIPIHKFQNCSSVKFYIWRRQDTNNKINQVPYFKKQQLIYTSKVFSLNKAKEKDGYQYVDEGFTIDFGEEGLSLEKAQYVIVAVPTPKSGTGSLFVETYKPKNSKDFCIRYVGAANASHFDYSEAYQEIWYNSASAIVSKENYYETGTVISKTLTWTEKGLERINSVKPIIDENLTLGNKTKDSYELYVNTGGDWIQVTPNKDNVINSGGATTFKWKLVFKGDGKSTPKLAYNSKTGYAIKFILTRAKPASFIDLSEEENYNKSMCITSKPFDGDDILRQYIGDMNFGLTHSRFEGYEFARIWADKNLNQKLLIDIQASDRQFKYLDTADYVDLWSLHYCDLTLEDFEKTNVDYSDYEEEIEYDENNMRLKLDSNHSYNDDDIQILALKDFTKVKNNIDETDEKTITFTNKDSVEDNQIFLKKRFDSPVDLSKYTGLKFKFDIESKQTTSMILNGLAIYISSSKEEDVPSNTKNLPENLYKGKILDNADVLAPVIDPDVSSISHYDGKVLKINHDPNPEIDGDKIYPVSFYQYIPQYDEKTGKTIYKLQELFDLRSYSIYEISNIVCSDDNKSLEVRVEIDQDNTNMKYVEEIGIITLNDEDKYEVSQNYITTQLDARCDTDGTIIVTLTDSNGNRLKGKTIEYNGTSQKTLNDGEIYVPQQNSGSQTFIYNGEVETIENNEKRVYSEASIKTEYTKKIGFSANSVTIESLTDTVDYTKTTTLTVTCPEDGKIKAVLTEDENKLENKTIHLGSLKKANTDSNGEVVFTNIKGKETDLTVYYESEIIEDKNTHKKTLYKASGVKVSYDFRTPNERLTKSDVKIISANSINLTLNSVRAISEEVLKIYDPENIKLGFTTALPEDVINICPHKELLFDEDTYGDFGGSTNIKSIKATSPSTTQISIKHTDNTLRSPTTICYINNPFQGGISKYKHLGVQIASDVYIPKDCLRINICAKSDGNEVISSINLPTLNSIFYPNTSGTFKDSDGITKSYINLSQVFKKFDVEATQIKSISISVTRNFYDVMNKLITNDKPAINLFIGKVVLYRAETIPIYHNKMRFKFYNATNGEIDHYGKQDDSDTFAIRKIGAILDYD